MNKKIIERVRQESAYIIDNQETIRQVAEKFMVSKSTVHQDLSKRLIQIDAQLYGQVEEILNYHIQVRHIRGGESTKRKYLSKKHN